MEVNIEKHRADSYLLIIDDKSFIVSLDQLLTISCAIQRKIVNDLTNRGSWYNRGQLLRTKRGGLFIYDRMEMEKDSVYALCGITAEGRVYAERGRWCDVDEIAGMAAPSEVKNFFQILCNYKREKY